MGKKNKQKASSNAPAPEPAATTPRAPPIPPPSQPPLSSEQPPPQPPPPAAALSQTEIMQKLNSIPTFCILNGDSNIVGMASDQGGETCVWFTYADDARAMLALCREQNPDVPALHLGVTPLGLAFALAVGWADSHFVGDLRLQGQQATVEATKEALTEQVAAQGLDVGTWTLPVFCCDELSSATVMPVFLQRHDLVQAWVLSGRPKEAVPENLSVMDLRVLVHQMQTDAFAWSTVQFVGSPGAVALVREAKAAAAEVARHRAAALEPLAAAPDADAPPPLAEDEPPPLV